MLSALPHRSHAAYSAVLSAALQRLAALRCSVTACRCGEVPEAYAVTAFSTAAARTDPDAQPAADAAGGSDIFTSLHDAARSPAAVRRLDLTASPQLRCSNLLCDKVGEPCICRISRVFEQGVQELILRGNALTELPATTWRLASLQSLDLSDNQLSAVPPDIARLQQLQELRLMGNSEHLALPYAALAQLPQLRKLYVDRGIRQQMVKEHAAAPLLHWLHF